MYDMCMDKSTEQALYHSIAMLATLLLQIGDVGKQFYLKVHAQAHIYILTWYSASVVSNTQSHVHTHTCTQTDMHAHAHNLEKWKNLSNFLVPNIKILLIYFYFLFAIIVTSTNILWSNIDKSWHIHLNKGFQSSWNLCGHKIDDINVKKILKKTFSSHFLGRQISVVSILWYNS
jgi:hypothetical protein